MIAKAPEPEVVVRIIEVPVEVIREVVVERIVEVPVTVYQTTNVCPAEERKKPARRAIAKPAQVCK